MTVALETSKADLLAAIAGGDPRSCSDGRTGASATVAFSTRALAATAVA